MSEFEFEELTFTEYQVKSAQTAIYPGSGEQMGLIYCLLGLANEAGEVLGKYKKVLRDNDGDLTEEVRANLAAEFGDVLWYLSNGVNELGLSLESVAEANLDKLFSRKARGVIGGSGDNR